VARGHGLCDKVTANEASTADDQNPHGRNLVGSPPAPKARWRVVGRLRSDRGS
jgi:hypothetical protein